MMTDIKQQTSKRMPHIDRLKAIAMILVVIGHLLYFSINDEKQFDNVISNIINTFHLPLFFFLSGYVISYPPSIRKATNKCFSFLKPALVVGFVNALLIGRVREFIFNGGHIGYWYLLTLATFYLMMTLYDLNKSKNNIAGFLIDTFLSLAVWGSFMILTLHPNLFTEMLNLSSCFCFWPFFIIGHLSRKYNLDKLILQQPFIGIVSGALYLGAVATLYHDLDAVFYPLALLAVCALFAFFYHFRERNTFVNRQLVFIGTKTLDIYIYHYFFIRFIDLSSMRTGVSWPFELIILTTLAVIIVYASIALAQMVDTIKKKVVRAIFL